MDKVNMKKDEINEFFQEFQKLNVNSQNILIVAASCMLARQQMEEGQKEAG